jgi:hypothetical protein
MTIGRGGQQFSFSLTGLRPSQRSRRFRRRGDRKTMLLQFRHTCTSVCHSSSSSMPGFSSKYHSKISSKTSSGSVSIVTRPISHQSAVVAHEAAQNTYVDVTYLISSESSDVHDYLRSTSFPSSNQSGSVSQGGKEMMAGRWRDMSRRLDDRYSLEQG